MPHESRFAFIDLLRIIAAQVIVLHHLAFYGPLSDHAYPLAASPIDWLYQYGRLAVPRHTSMTCVPWGAKRN